MIKMDFLGLTTLTILDDALKMIAQRHGALDLSAIPLTDQETYEKVFQTAMVSGVFQFESNGMRDVLRRYKLIFFSSSRRHTRCLSDWSSDVCSSDLGLSPGGAQCQDRRADHGLRHRRCGRPQGRRDHRQGQAARSREGRNRPALDANGGQRHGDCRISEERRGGKVERSMSECAV